MKLDELTLNCKSGKEFEKRILKYLEDLGFEGKRIGYDDCGVDIIATITVKNVTKTYNIQCKYYNTTVGKQPIHEVFSGSNYYNNNGIPVVITNNKMTIKALEFAKKQGVEVICDYEWTELSKVENSGKAGQKTGILGVIIGKMLKDSTYVNDSIQRVDLQPKESKSDIQLLDKIARKKWESEEELREQREKQYSSESKIGFISSKTDYG